MLSENLWTAFTDYNLDMNKIGQIRLAAPLIRSHAAGWKIATGDKRLLIRADKIGSCLDGLLEKLVYQMAYKTGIFIELLVCW